MGRFPFVACAALGPLLALAPLSPARAGTVPVGDLADLSLEQLGRVEITSVSRRAERLSDAPASIFVISADDIRRSGATSLPEALRLAPNLEVARVNASNFAISARGFNNSLGNKLLVLIDGRTVYTPLFSGVFWDAQYLLLEDVERIEVISGPGATLWGANAVNGVINVITRSASRTQGWLLGVDAGSDGRSAVARYGGHLGAAGSYRAYARYTGIDNSQTASGSPLPDGWQSRQAGFRADWGDAERGFTLQGDAYDGESEQRPLGPIEVSGMNLLAAWNRRRADGSSLHMQAYFDRTERNDPILFHDHMDVVDFEFQQGKPFGSQLLFWGGGYRHAHDRVQRGLLTTFIPGERDLHWENVFVQDELRLRDSLRLTLGIKLDRNVYTGTELLPSLRVAWKPRPNQLLWAAASRAVRAPSRIDKEFFLPATPPFLIDGGPDFESELADVFELGYRSQPTNALSFSATLFHHSYDKLRSGERQPNGSFQVQNGTAGRVWGLEAWGDLQVTERWRLSAGLMELRQRFWTKPGFHDPDGAVDLGNDPRYQWRLRSAFEASSSLEFNLEARGVGELPVPRVPAYTTVDAGLRWQHGDHLECSLLLRDLFDSGHREFAPGPAVAPSEFGREAAIRIRWRQ